MGWIYCLDKARAHSKRVLMLQVIADMPLMETELPIRAWWEN